MSAKAVSYSFIKPRLKPIFSLFSLIWISLITFIIFAGIIAHISIKLVSYNLEKSSAANLMRYDDYTRKITIIKDYNAALKLEQEEISEVFATNSALKRSIRNIFDIVPDTITLGRVELTSQSLVIQGLAPSRETYLLLMEAPLKSIFASTQTNFFQLPNGWLNFTSVNRSGEYDE